MKSGKRKSYTQRQSASYVVILRFHAGHIGHDHIINAQANKHYSDSPKLHNKYLSSVTLKIIPSFLLYTVKQNFETYAYKHNAARDFRPFAEFGIEPAAEFKPEPRGNKNTEGNADNRKSEIHCGYT